MKLIRVGEFIQVFFFHLILGLFYVFLLPLNVNAAGFYNITTDGLNVTGGITYNCGYDGTDNDCADSVAYGVAPNTTSAVFNVRQSVYPQYHTYGEYSYDNFPVLLYANMSMGRAPINLGGTMYGPMLAGNGDETGLADYRYQYVVDGQLDFVTLTFCVSKNIDWVIDSFYLPNSYIQVRMLGGYFLTNYGGAYTYDNSDVYIKACTLKVDDNQDGVVDLYLSGQLYQVVYTTNYYQFIEPAQGDFSTRVFMTFKNVGSTPLYVAFTGLGPRRNYNRFTSADESVYLKVQQSYISDIIQDFWQTEIIDQQELKDLVNSSNSSGASNSGLSWFRGFNETDNNGISGIVTSPIRFIQSFSSTCSPVSLSVFNNNINLPCGTTIFWNRNDVSVFKVLWNTLFGGFIIYKLCVKVFKIIQKIKDPTDDRVEVVNL